LEESLKKQLDCVMETLTVFIGDQKTITLTYPKYAENIVNSVVIVKSYPVGIEEKKLYQKISMIEQQNCTHIDTKFNITT
jgi:hypothetical protein